VLAARGGGRSGKLSRMASSEPPPADVTIRCATRADEPALARLRRLWTEEEGPAPAEDDGFEARFAAWFEREASHRLFWLAERAGEPVGMLNMLVFGRMPRPGREMAGWGYIANTFVVGALRDRGVGRGLLDAAIAHARAERFERIVLRPSARSVPFYERAGFAPASSLLLLEL
jgi:GNAT superfamily N-acetyltransferase